MARAMRRYVRRVAAKPGKSRAQGSTGVTQRKQQRKRLRRRRAGLSS